MKSHTLILLLLTVSVLSSCVHREFEYPLPGGLPVDVEFQLQYYDKEMPLHTVVDYNNTRSSAGNTPASRHIINVYDSNGREVASAVLTDEAENSTLTRRHTLSLLPGTYTAVCWTDYTEGGTDDWHYDTSAFPNVKLCCSAADGGLLVHSANTPWRDAYSGSRAFSVDNDALVTYGDKAGVDRVIIEMRRPMARFIFEATDFEEFAHAHALAEPRAGEATVLPGYEITFLYADYMPSIYDAHTDAPIDSRVGASFTGEPRSSSTGSGAIEMGSDFVFVHPLETSVSVAMEVRDTGTGELLAHAGPYTVPLLRNRLTIVRGRFLTARSGSGMVIDTGFDGEYNIEIK